MKIWLIVFILLYLSALAQAQNEIYVSSQPQTIEAMLDLAAVSKADTVYDLGSGDGRIVIAAAKRGAKAVGIEIDPMWVDIARRNIQEQEVKATIIQGDFYTLSISAATVVMLFLGAPVLKRLSPRLKTELHNGTRIVSNSLPLPGWEPKEVRNINQLLNEPNTRHWWWAPLYLYQVKR